MKNEMTIKDMQQNLVLGYIGQIEYHLHKYGWAFSLMLSYDADNIYYKIILD